MPEFIERRILIGAITSTSFLQKIQSRYRSRYMQSDAMRTLMHWCVEYFQQYREAPQRNIEGILDSKVREKAFHDKEDLADIEEILEGLSEEYTEKGINVDHLVDEARNYFRARGLVLLKEEVEDLLDRGEIDEAETAVGAFTSLVKEDGRGIDPFQEMDAVRQAFEEDDEDSQLIRFPGVLGKVIGSQLAKDSLVGIMAPEKRGKTWWLWEFAYRALRSQRNVAFFQAGDMTEAQMLRRIYVHLAQRSHKRKYCGELWIPLLDCRLGLKGDCNHAESDDAPMEGLENREIQNMPFDDMEKILLDFPDHAPCTKCLRKNPWKFPGAVWYRHRGAVDPLTWRQGYKLGRQFKKRYKSKLFLDTYSNDSLSVGMIRNRLDLWKEVEGFVPHVIVIDYADLLVPPRRQEFRHEQNEIWKALRALSQDFRCCVITATQADADSYGKASLALANFSEDKRKYAHVTAMYGLNQTAEEKKKGLMRFSELLVREDDFDMRRQVKVIQRFQIGRPCLGSFL
jgi:hypothetical protein